MVLCGNQNQITMQKDTENVGLLKLLDQLTDPRVERTKLHLLEDIVMLTIMAVICGADSWTEIEEYGNTKEEWLKGYLKLPHGIPSHDTIGSVMSRIKPEEFENFFVQWMLSKAKLSQGEVVSIDGKTLRRSYDKFSGKSAIHMVSAWASQNRMVLGQIKTADKSNEITAIPKLLETLVLKDSIVTIDAMGCQKKIAEKIIDGNADYVLALKGNQGEFHEGVKHQFEFLQPVQIDEQTDVGHGRIETRKCSVIGNLQFLDEAAQWKNLKTVAKVEATRIIGEKQTIETRYYISSIEPDAVKINNAVRTHWQIENCLHWSLDVTFKEDECRIRNGNGAENFSVVRRIALNLLKNETSIRKGIKTKRMKAGWDNEYLTKILKI